MSSSQLCWSVGTLYPEVWSN